MSDSRTVLFRWTPKTRRVAVLGVIFSVVLLVATLLLGFMWGRSESAELRQKFRHLVADFNRQTQELHASQQQLTVQGKSAEIDRLAAEQVQAELADLRLEVAVLKRDVEFYRGLMAPSERDTGFQLHNYSFEKLDESGTIAYRFMLTNVGGRGQVIKGTLSLALQFELDGQQKTVSVTELQQYVGESPIKLRFRFFQQVEGSFRLPDNVEAPNIMLSSDVKDASGSAFYRELAWEQWFNSE